MRTKKTIVTSPRRKPSSPHGTKRRERILEAAAELIGEDGFDNVTMSAISVRLNSSLGTLYQYFSDKAELALTLRVAYGEAFASSWKSFTAANRDVPFDDSVSALVQMLVEFTRQHPAYLPLLDIVPQYRRRENGRKELRRCLGDFILQVSPKTPETRACLVACVVLQITKALLKEMASKGPKAHRELQHEFTVVLQTYLRASLVLELPHQGRGSRRRPGSPSSASTR